MAYSYEDYYNNLKQIAESKGYTVILANNVGLPDYVGMNDMAAKSMGIKNYPKREIRIKKSLTWSARYHTLRHEMVERKGMAGGSDESNSLKNSYAEEHLKALDKEDEIIRRGLNKK